jgi:hypothetical protein
MLVSVLKVHFLAGHEAPNLPIPVKLPTMTIKCSRGSHDSNGLQPRAPLLRFMMSAAVKMESIRSLSRNDNNADGVMQIWFRPIIVCTPSKEKKRAKRKRGVAHQRFVV